MMRRIAIIALLAVIPCLTTAARSQPIDRAPVALLEGPTFAAAFDSYWLARVHARVAENRLCALDRSSERRERYRQLFAELDQATAWFEAYHPRALNDLRRPYRIGPAQMLCDDAGAAHEAVSTFEASVQELRSAIE